LETNATQALALSGIDAYYGDSHVLHGVGFALEEGRLLGLLGRNGAGKTTCMSAIMGFVKPRRGSITLFGEQIGGLAPDTIAHRGIGLVPQGRRVFKSLTVRENLSVAEQRRKNTGGRPAWTFERVYGLFPRLKERQQQLAGSLSGGEQQMLAIGRALMARPRLILMDEPSMGLSPLLVKEVFGIIRRLNRDLGITILLVEQNARMALSVASYGYIMEQGKVVLDGDAAALAENEDVKEFYLGGHGADRKSFRNLKSYKRRKRWL
jgi:branched-chain amino acid transport system ATP-binding protein